MPADSRHRLGYSLPLELIDLSPGRRGPEFPHGALDLDQLPKADQLLPARFWLLLRAHYGRPDRLGQLLKADTLSTRCRHPGNAGAWSYLIIIDESKDDHRNANPAQLACQTHHVTAQAAARCADRGNGCVAADPNRPADRGRRGRPRLS
jgi:hypothetical protein